MKRWHYHNKQRKHPPSNLVTGQVPTGTKTEISRLVSAVSSAVQVVQATKNLQNHNQERAE
jgi:hypothetical protein